MSNSLPVYGQYAFENLSTLVEGMKTISSRHLQGAAFSVFLVLQDQRKQYGLTLEELVHQYADWEGHLHGITFVASSPKSEVVRISVQFFPPPTPHMVRFVIASGNARTNYAIRGILTGEAIPETRSGSVKLPIAEILAPAIRLRPDALMLPKGRAYGRPTLHLHDHFYFDRQARADELVDLLNYLSERFLQKTPFHLRLETLDGDFHLHLDRRELRYLYERHGTKLLMVYIDALTPDDQWMSLRLSYHPLSSGPNAEISLLSDQADALLDVLHQHLAIDPPAYPLPIGHYETMEMAIWPESMAHLSWVLEEISRKLLDRTPPVAYIVMQDGSEQTGLSLYQLGQRFGGSMHLLKRVVFTFGRVSTGQIALIWMEQTPEGGCALHMGTLWGFPDIQKAVQEFLTEQIPEARPLPNQDTAEAPVHSLAIWAPAPASQRQQGSFWEQVAEKAQISAQTVSVTSAHQIWDQLIGCLHTQEGLLVDMTYKQPHAVFAARLMKRMGKKVIVGVEQGKTIPDELVDYPRLVYRGERPDIQELAKNLRAVCNSF